MMVKMSGIDHPYQWFGGRSFAQHGDDFAILNIFKRLQIERPSYLDIGASHPFDLSNTALLYKRGCRGVNVEANPHQYMAFVNMRPEDTNLQYAVVGADKPPEIALHCISTTSGLNSTVHAPGAKFVIMVPTITADLLVESYCKDGLWPDLLSLDAEGADVDILKSINWQIGNCPKVICVEAVSQLGDVSKELRALLEPKYFLHSWAGANMIFINYAFWSMYYLT